jgi:mono/diheme cytochrome c family protein
MMREPRDRSQGKPPWRPPTRRAFVAMIGAAAAALAVRERTTAAPADNVDDGDRPPIRWTGTPRWIGHC